MPSAQPPPIDANEFLNPTARRPCELPSVRPRGCTNTISLKIGRIQSTTGFVHPTGSFDECDNEGSGYPVDVTTGGGRQRMLLFERASDLLGSI
jgi:hypothetical protein